LPAEADPRLSKRGVAARITCTEFRLDQSQRTSTARKTDLIIAQPAYFSIENP
jgi:flagellar basal body rod protein FlgG